MNLVPEFTARLGVGFGKYFAVEGEDRFLSHIRQLTFEAGLAIVLLAIMLDRICKQPEAKVGGDA